MVCKQAVRHPDHIENREESCTWEYALEQQSEFTGQNMFFINDAVTFAMFRNDISLKKQYLGMYGSRFLRRNLIHYFWCCGNNEMVKLLCSARLSPLDVYEEAFKFVPNCAVQ